MSGYIIDSILSEEELNEARDLAASLKFYRVFQMYNLFDLDRLDLDQSELDKYAFSRKLKKYSKKRRCIGFYFLRYVKDSFTRMHSDSNSEITIVTMIDENALVGGYSLAMQNYESRDRPSDQECVRGKYEENNPPYGQDIIPDVLPVKVGESLVYGPHLSHGVSKVYSGERLVLVSWYTDKDKEDEKEEE